MTGIVIDGHRVLTELHNQAEGFRILLDGHPVAMTLSETETTVTVWRDAMRLPSGLDIEDLCDVTGTDRLRPEAGQRRDPLQQLPTVRSRVLATSRA